MSLFQYLQIQYILHCIIQVTYDVPVRDLEQTAAQSDLTHPFEGPELLITLCKDFCTHFIPAYMQTTFFWFRVLKASLQLMVIYWFFLSLLPSYRLKFSFFDVVYFLKEKSAGYYQFPWVLAIFLMFPCSSLKTEIRNYE